MAYNFKWSKEEIMRMTRKERHEWISQIQAIIRREKSEQSSFLENDLFNMIKKNRNREENGGMINNGGNR